MIEKDVALSPVETTAIESIDLPSKTFEASFNNGEKADVERLTKDVSSFYEAGAADFVAGSYAEVALPDKRLWPEDYEDVYEVIENFKFFVLGTHEIAFFELFKNSMMHGGGIVKINASWQDKVFTLICEDRGSKNKSESIHGMGLNIIGGFTTNGDFKIEKMPSGGLKFILKRSLLTAQANYLHENSHLLKKLEQIKTLYQSGNKLPALNPDSDLTYHYNSALGRYGGTIAMNLLGIEVERHVFTKEEAESSDL